MNARLIAGVVGLLAAIVGANYLTSTYGLVTWLGLTATAGTWVAGFAFVARDTIHEAGGKRWVVSVIIIGALLSAILSPRLALASGIAFLLSELADFAVYTPLRNRSRTAAAILSNTVGAVVDTIVFLTLAGFPLTGTATQVLVKVGVTTLFVLAVRFITGKVAGRSVVHGESVRA